MKFYIPIFSVLIVLGSCSKINPQQSNSERLNDTSGIVGKKEYLGSPYVAAGDRVYMVGHQDGTFPDLGWHVEGEMGGIWNHPIKLMDGFTGVIKTATEVYCLDNAVQFINYPYGNRHIYNLPGLEVERFQYVPDGQQGLVVEFLVKNLTAQKNQIELEITGHVDLMPVWLGERTGMIDHEDQLNFDEKRQAWVGKDAGNDWYVIFGTGTDTQAEEGPSIHCNYDPQGKGTAGMLNYTIDLPKGSNAIVRMVITGSYTSLDDAEDTFDHLFQQHGQLLQAKKDHYANIASHSKVTIPDKDLEKAFEWVKYNTEWLVRDVPEIGRGLGAGMPDYPWWFGVDNEYTLQGAIATGRKDLVYATIDLIHTLSENHNGNGRIVHEVSTNGVVFNPGNINETPQFASLIWFVYQWTGDKNFLQKYFPTIKKGLVWLMEENDLDGNLFPDGYGMMEIHGLESEMIDVATYTQAAFADAAKMAAVLGDRALAENYQNTADRLKIKINEEFWVPRSNSFADFIGTASEALHLIDAALVRADTLEKPWAVEELREMKKEISTLPPNKKQGFVVFHNWVVNTPMEMGIADHEKAIIALDKAKKYVNPFGVFVTGIDRDELSEGQDGSFKGGKVFTYTGAVMTLPTGVQAIAENNYGRPDMALDYLKRMTRSFSFALPGSIYEVSPDYGMMAQAWNLYSYAVPIVTQFFGIQPDAGNKTIKISPVMPTDWNEAKIEKVIIGDNEINLSYQKMGEEIHLEITQKLKDWDIDISYPKGKYTDWEVKGDNNRRSSTEDTEGFKTSGEKISVKLK